MEEMENFLFSDGEMNSSDSATIRIIRFMILLLKVAEVIKD
jgi:hypothetical protein